MKFWDPWLSYFPVHTFLSTLKWQLFQIQDLQRLNVLTFKKSFDENFENFQSKSKKSAQWERDQCISFSLFQQDTFLVFHRLLNIKNSRFSWLFTYDAFDFPNITQNLINSNFPPIFTTISTTKMWSYLIKSNLQFSTCLTSHFFYPNFVHNQSKR